MVYADCAYYKAEYRGKEIDDADFPRLSARASAYLDSISTAADHPNDEAVKLAACAVAEAWLKNENGGELVSETVGPWSKTFSSDGKTGADRLLEAARMYLGPAGLMRTVEWA